VVAAQLSEDLNHVRIHSSYMLPLCKLWWEGQQEGTARHQTRDEQQGAQLTGSSGR